MKILIACEESQRLCIGFRAFGHDAYSCDIKPCSGGFPQWHIQDDALNLLKFKWDIIIAHPPCTYLSNAGACRLYPQKGILDYSRYELGLAAKKFFMEFYNCSCSRVCIENPLPSKIFNLPSPTQIIQPYYFGDHFSKKTLLWLRGLPPLAFTNIVSHRPFIACGTSRYKGIKEKAGIVRSAADRSKTFSGIALAMVNQWGIN